MAELGAAGDDRERLRRLTERLDAAAQRAERLLSESVLEAAVGAREPAAEPEPEVAHDDDSGDPELDPERPPAAGWERPAGEHRRRDRWLDPDELELLMALLAGVRDRIPPELRRRLADAVRELLIALRALIDWYLERAERPTAPASDVHDIPIL
ncbi:MAG TPA: hypothetical protein VFW09_07165 [Solirubrobacteraceae bacterium]|nr:hypothetical protein [Solirubrobacteraceae bacterium]